MIGNLISEGIHFYISEIITGLMMIFFLKGEAGKKKDVIVDVISFSLIFMIYTVFCQIHISLILNIYGFFGYSDFILLALIYFYVKKRYRVSYCELLSLIYALVLKVSYMIVVFCSIKMTVRFGLKAFQSDLCTVLQLFVEFAIIPMAVTYLMYRYVSKWRHSNGLYFDSIDEKILITIYVVIILLIGKIESLKNVIPYSSLKKIGDEADSIFYNAMSDNGIILIIGIIFLVLLNFYFYLKANNLYKNLYEKEVENHMRKYADNYLDKIISHSEQVSKISHDISNHMKVIDVLSKKEDGSGSSSAKIQEYIKPLKNTGNTLPVKIRSGNEIVDIILNEKIDDMEKFGIKYDIKATVPNRIKIDQYELSAILFNTIDNSIEACSHVDNPYINIEMFPKGSSLVYNIVNTYDEKNKHIDGIERNYSNKENIHRGYGCRIVEEIVEKNFGDIDVSKDGSEYRVSMYFNI